jgi:hypothetical protein
MIEIEPYGVVVTLLGILRTGLQLVVPVWLFLRFRYWGILIAAPFLWLLSYASLHAFALLVPQADVNFGAAMWLLFGLPSCFVLSGIMYALTIGVKALIRKFRPVQSSAGRRSRWHRLEIVGLPIVLAAVLFIGILGSLPQYGADGPAVSMGLLGTTQQDTLEFSATIENHSLDTVFYNVVAVCELVDGGGGVMEHFTFHREEMLPGEEWDIGAPFHKKNGASNRTREFPLPYLRRTETHRAIPPRVPVGVSQNTSLAVAGRHVVPCSPTSCWLSPRMAFRVSRLGQRLPFPYRNGGG